MPLLSVYELTPHMISFTNSSSIYFVNNLIIKMREFQYIKEYEKGTFNLLNGVDCIKE